MLLLVRKISLIAYTDSESLYFTEHFIYCVSNIKHQPILWLWPLMRIKYRIIPNVQWTSSLIDTRGSLAICYPLGDTGQPTRYIFYISAKFTSWNYLHVTGWHWYQSKETLSIHFICKGAFRYVEDKSLGCFSQKCIFVIGILLYSKLWSTPYIADIKFWAVLRLPLLWRYTTRMLRRLISPVILDCISKDLSRQQTLHYWPLGSESYVNR